MPRDLTGISNELAYVELQRVQQSLYLYLQQFWSMKVPYFKNRNEVICTIFQLEARKPPWNGSLVPTRGHSWNAGERLLGLWISTQLMIPQKYERPIWLSLPTDVLSPWWRHQMETFSALLAICAGNSPVTGQWRGASMFSLICTLNKRLSKQSRGWWFETPSRL